MKKFATPSRSIDKNRILDQRSSVEPVESLLHELVLSLEDLVAPHFGVVSKGLFSRDRFAIDFNDVEWEFVPIRKCVMLLRRDAEGIESMADVVSRYWRISPEAVNGLSMIEGWDCRRVAVEYAFDGIEEARAWLDRNPVPETNIAVASAAPRGRRRGDVSQAPWTRKVFGWRDLC